MTDASTITLGVIADTHIPDRAVDLHPAILPLFRAAGVAHILHAGDVAARRVLETLAEVAPVCAVKGNRDFFLPELQMTASVTYNGVRVAVVHGHFGLRGYLLDKLNFIREGYRFDRYVAPLIQAADSPSEDGAGNHRQPARVIIFGHTHRPELVWRQDRLLFNPGSASLGAWAWIVPSVGLLHIAPGGEVTGEIIPLEGYAVRGRRWVKI